MNAKLPNKQWEFWLRIFFLFVVFFVLLISIVEFLRITETSSFSRDFEIYARLFYFTTPYLLGWIFFISAIAFFIFDLKRKLSTVIPITIGLIACVVSTSFNSTFPSIIIKSIWLGSVLLLSILFLFQFLPGLTNKNLKMPVLLLSVMVVIGSLLLKLSVQKLPQIFPEIVIILWSGILLGLALISGFIHILKHGNSNHNQLDGISAIGFILAWTPFCVLLFQMANVSTSPITPWILLPITIYPVIVGGLIQFKENKTNYKPGLSDSRRLSGFLISYGMIGLIVLGVNIFNQSRPQNFLQPPLFIGLLMFLLPIVLIYILMEKRKISKNRTNFSVKDNRTYSSLDKNIGVNHPEKNEDIYEELRQQIKKITDTDLYHHFIFDPSANEYFAYPFYSDKTSDLRFTSDSDLVQYLVNNQSPIIISEVDPLPAELSDEKDKLELLAANVIMPIYVENKLVGWLAFTSDSQISGDNDQIITIIKPLVEQFSDSYLSRHHQMELEQRIGDMNVLTRIVQGVNYTLALDDIYELIYAQTTQVIPSSDFYIILKDHQTQSSRYVFFVELDERISEKENTLLPQNQSLDAQVIESGRGLIINNYIEYANSRNYSVLYPEVMAAIIVPLNTGAITNG